jgi:Zn-dependent protease/predicted transcriptional regulator
MFWHRVKLCTLFGFEVRIDATWLLLAVLVTWSLASAFPHLVPGLSAGAYWPMAIATALGLFGSIVFHEMSHALVARRNGILIRGITLFIFGGVAELEAEPGSARGELLMAIAGPAASLLLGLLLFLLAGLWPAQRAIAGVFWYLGLINWTLAIFNLVPAFPLDGGRVLRAALWLWRRDRDWATRIAADIGSAFAIFLMVLGLLRVVTGDFVGGMWSFLIGMFLRAAAAGSYRQTMVARLLAGLNVGDVMNRAPVAVPSNISIATMVEKYVYAHHHRWFPVIDGGRVIGSVSTREAASVDRGLWQATPVSRIMSALGPDQIVSPDLDLMTALMRMQRSGASRLVVVRNGQMVGLLSSRDILQELALRRELARP